MNIVQICPSPFPQTGGPARNYAQFQHATRSQAICFVRPGEGPLADCVVTPAAVLHTSGLPVLFRYYYVPPSRDRILADRIIERADCVIVHSFYQYAATWAAAHCLAHRRPYIVVLHGALDPWTLKNNRIIKRVWMELCGRPYLRRAARVLCATDREFEKASPFIRPEQKAVLHWACPAPRIDQDPRKRMAIRAELGIGETDRALVFLGRLDRMKRPIELVETCARAGVTNLKLVVIGPDGNVTRKDVENAARRMGWAGLIALGPVFSERKYELLHAADAYISLSARENFNFTAAEAMGSECPVILSRGNDLGWDLPPGLCSWQLTRDDRGHAEAAIRSFAECDVQRLRSMGRAARQWVSENLSTERFTDGLLSIVRGVGRSRSGNSSM